MSRHKHITAEIIADSISPSGNRLTTFIVTCPRIVLAEFNTHRMLSRNSASSRAIPFKKMVEKVENEPFIPIAWQKDHKGMQGTEYWTNNETVQEALNLHTPAINYFDRIWLEARDAAVYNACHLSQKGTTKQLCNRLLEPFLYHTIIVTASDWENFFALRAHEAAEIHIQNLAFKMLEIYNNNTPKLLKPGQWHIPFGNKITKSSLEEQFGRKIKRLEGQELAVKIATARCARVSYLNYEGENDYKKDIKLHDRLSSMGHWSPFEHCAKAMSTEEKFLYSTSKPAIDDGSKLYDYGWSGNFKGFIQYRKTFQGENKNDTRVIDKS